MTGPVKVVNCTLYFDNPYQRMLFAPLAGRFQAVRGTVDEALEARRADPRTLLHVHWEEHLLRGLPTAAEARIATNLFIRTLRTIKREGGAIAWTVHNLQPHEQEHLEAFREIRVALAETADRILVHGTDAVAALAEQVPFDSARLFYLPHPSYLGVYESAEDLAAGLEAPPGNAALFFGKLRRYKGLELMLEELTPELLAGLGARIEIRGEPLATDDYVPELRARHDGREDVTWDLRRIPDAELPALLRGARCVVAPYTRFLTSGVALLTLSLGVPLVGPRSRGLQEALPPVAQSLLFDPEVPGDLARAVGEAFALDPAAHRALRGALVERARHLEPRRISRLLGGVYEELSAGR